MEFQKVIRHHLLVLSILCWMLPSIGAVGMRGDSNFDVNSTLLIKSGILMTHDSGTGYLKTGIVRDVVIDYTKTQSVGLGGQLECGARAFDIRPAVNKKGDLVMHHGPVDIAHSFKDGMEEVIEWCNNHTEELVIAMVTDCAGDSCNTMVQSVLKTLNLTPYDDCTRVSTMTVGEAKTAGKLSGGGSLLVLTACVDERYDPSVVCYSGTHVCYEKSGGPPFDHFWASLNDTTSRPSTTQLWMAQAHWQNDADTVIDGTLHLSSIMKDESKAQVNKLVAERISSAAFTNINIVEVDNICDFGPELAAAIANFTRGSS